MSCARLRLSEIVKKVLTVEKPVCVLLRVCEWPSPQWDPVLTTALWEEGKK